MLNNGNSNSHNTHTQTHTQKVASSFVWILATLTIKELTLNTVSLWYDQRRRTVLTAMGYTGDAGNSLWYHNGQQFVNER